jgi:hypothetical protein
MPEKKTDADEQKTKDDKEREFIPPLDFSSILSPFYMQALIKLGLVEDPISGKPQENLDLAKRLIDLLDLLKDRTKGNLEADEEKFLESILLQLKSRYLEKAKIINL